jgi:hypothetical protein
MPILYMLKVSVYAGFMQIFSGTYCGLSFIFLNETLTAAFSLMVSYISGRRLRLLP